MERFRFPLLVAVTSLALVVALVGVGGLLVNNALANGPFGGGGAGPWSGAPWSAGRLPVAIRCTSARAGRTDRGTVRRALRAFARRARPAHRQGQRPDVDAVRHGASVSATV